MCAEGMDNASKVMFTGNVGVQTDTAVRFHLKPNKVFLFRPETGERIPVQAEEIHHGNK